MFSNAPVQQIIQSVVLSSYLPSFGLLFTDNLIVNCVWHTYEQVILLSDDSIAVNSDILCRLL